MIYMKHATLGNANFEDKEQAQKESEGWMKWPRTKEKKEEKVVVTEQKFVAVKTRSELNRDADALGIKVDGRWSDERLAQEVNDALNK